MSVYITVTRKEAEGLAALLNGGLSIQLNDDLGLSSLQTKLGKEFPNVRLTGVGTYGRRYSDTPAGVKDLDASNDVYIVTE